MNKWKKFGLVAAMTAMIGALGAGVITSAEDAENNIPETEAAVEAEVENTVIEKLGSESTATEDMTIQEVCKAAMPAMVAITNKSVEEVRNYFQGDPFSYFGFGFGFGHGYDDFFGDYGSEPQTRESVSMGSGVIVGMTDDSILVATNAHVVSGATELSVAFIDDSAAPAELVGSDESRDLAVIKIPKDELEDSTLEAITVLPFGSSSELEVGQSVVAIGNALGYGQSASSGIVSALGRTVTSNGEMGQAVETQEMIQTDASINPGNSGGALLNLKGELIGINSAKDAGTLIEGMGYAIPIDTAEPILTDIANGRVPESASGDEDGVRLGVTVATITEEYQASYLIPNGVYVIEVEEGKPADKAGIQEGDIITAIDGMDISSVEELKQALANYEPGDSARLTISRESENAFGDEKSYQTGSVTVRFGEGETHMAA